MEVTATVGDKEMPLENSALTWAVEDATIATVDDAGVVHGLKNGTTHVYGKVEDFSDEILVKVEIPTVRYQDTETNFDATTWKVTKSGVKEESISACGSNGIAVDYTISSSRNAYVKLAKNLPIWSRPDSIELQLNPGNATIKQITIQVTPSQGAKAANLTITPTLTPNEVNRIAIPVGDVADITDAGIYPLTINAISVYFSDAVNTVGHLEMPHIYGVYKAIAPDASVESITIDNATEALIFVPNPVEAGEIVSINASADAVYSIYNAAGALIAKGNGNQIATANLNTGIYIISTTDNGTTRTARLVIK